MDTSEGKNEGKMALEAVKTTTKERVKLWQYSKSDIRELMHQINDNRKLFTCDHASCDCELYIKALDSDNVTTHFARYPNTGDATYHPVGGESPQHLMAKQKLAQLLQRNHPQADVTTEKVLVGDMLYSDIRRADVFVTHPDGKTEVHEIQYSPQPTAVTERRTRDYRSFGIDEVVWWWGDRVSNRIAYFDWCIENCDYYGTAITKWETLLGKQLITDVELTLHHCKRIREERHAKREAERARQQALKEEYDKLATEALMLGVYDPEVYPYDSHGAIGKLRERIRWARLQGRALPPDPDPIPAPEPARPIWPHQKSPLVGRRFMTWLAGWVTIKDYDPVQDIYYSDTGLWWRLADNDIMMDTGGKEPPY